MTAMARKGYVVRPKVVVGLAMLSLVVGLILAIAQLLAAAS